MRYLVALVCLGLLVAIPYKVAGETVPDDWYVYIHVWLGKAHNQLTIGQNKKASEGFDRSWETPVASMFLVGRVSSFFYHPEWGRKSHFFWRDIRPLNGLPREWEFRVKTKKPNEEVQLKWDLSRVKDGLKLYLKRKEDKEYINLHTEKSYSYKSTAKEAVFILKAE